eukprot:scaffold80_cov50-Phaeocystis_antarctica.AAC.1
MKVRSVARRLWRLLFAGERAVEQQVDEVAAGLDSEHHPRLDEARGAQLAQPRPRRPLGRARQVAAHVVRVESDEVTQPVRHEHRAQPSRHHGLDRCLVAVVPRAA